MSEQATGTPRVAGLEDGEPEALAERRERNAGREAPECLELGVGHEVDEPDLSATPSSAASERSSAS